MNFSGILIGVLTFFLIGLFHPIVIYAEYVASHYEVNDTV